ncbi:hypothetical protein QUB08_22865 [Microcoleus sp. BR0-C5]|uniref:hypothetical protein n=1 Tax=Microcoleus sp. BR0-C5 TaxID=2818713 RepID=UPI002FD13F8F
MIITNFDIELGNIKSAIARIDERSIALLNRRYTQMDADGGKGDRTFCHKGRSLFLNRR